MANSFRFAWFLAAIFVLVVAQEGRSKAHKNAIIQGAYIIEYEEGHDPAQLTEALRNESYNVRMKFNYELFKGVSVQLQDAAKFTEHADQLSKLPVVKKVWPVRRVYLPDHETVWAANPSHIAKKRLSTRASTTTPATDTYSTHIMTQVDKMRAKGITGKGFRIAIIDTGIDYGHPALGGCFGPGCLVEVGYDLVGDDYGSNDTYIPYPDNDPMDCQGHGTHVAGIIAAQTNPLGFTGAAIGATLGIYRVFGCSGASADDVITAAFLKAYEEGADIISASLGGTSGWSETVQSVAISRINDKGVPVVVAAGNDGDIGLFNTAGPADAKGLASIGGFWNTVYPVVFFYGNYTVDKGVPAEFKYVYEFPYDGNADAWASVPASLDLYVPELHNLGNQTGCEPFPADFKEDISDKIVLLDQADCDDESALANAADKGAQYVMVVDIDDETKVGPAIFQLEEPTILAVSMVDSSVANVWIKELKAGHKVSLQMFSVAKSKQELVSLPNPAYGGAIYTYTTYGPTFEMDLKPAYAAPGGNILSTWPLKLGTYAVLSGTSMATPLAAAITALVGQVRDKHRREPSVLQSYLASTAKPQRRHAAGKFLPYLATVAQQGGGIIQAYDAAYTTLAVEPFSVSFNDTAHAVKFMDFKIQNTGVKPVTLSVSNKPAITLYTLDTDYALVLDEPEPVTRYATLQFSATKITIGPGGNQTVRVSPTAPQGVDPRRLALWSGYIFLNATDGSSLSLPYQGLAGSLRDHQLLTKNATWMANVTDTDNNPFPANAKIVLPGPGSDDGTILPRYAITLTLGSSFVAVHVVPLNPGPLQATFDYKGYKTIGQLAGFPYLYQPRAYSQLDWDGQLDSGNYVPPGKYKLVTHALRIFGDPAKDQDYDVSETDPFSIAYK